MPEQPVGSNESAEGFVTPKNSARQCTLTYRLGEFLSGLQNRFGKRDPNFTPLGIEFFGDSPHTFFPQPNNVSITLSYDARHNPSRAIYELAHECVHLLAPTQNAPIVEEGLAHKFAGEVAIRFGAIASSNPRYLYAAGKLEELLQKDADAIAKIRKQYLRFDDWKPDLIRKIIPKLPPLLAEELCENAGPAWIKRGL
jgi:hypothetical protein